MANKNNFDFEKETKPENNKLHTKNIPPKLHTTAP